MDHLNQRGQVLIESLFVVFCVVSLLLFFQLMIDHQRKETTSSRLSKVRKDQVYVQENEYFEAK